VGSHITATKRKKGGGGREEKMRSTPLENRTGNHWRPQSLGERAGGGTVGNFWPTGSKGSSPVVKILPRQLQLKGETTEEHGGAGLKISLN